MATERKRQSHSTTRKRTVSDCTTPVSYTHLFAGLSNTQILILALEASQKLEWNIEELTLEGVRFDVPMSIKSHGEEITVSIQEGSDGEISVRSQSIAMQLVDYGKNRKNIQSLQKAMEEIKSTLSPEELEQKAKKLEDDFNRPLTEEERCV